MHARCTRSAPVNIRGLVDVREAAAPPCIRRSSLAASVPMALLRLAGRAARHRSSFCAGALQALQQLHRPCFSAYNTAPQLLLAEPAWQAVVCLLVCLCLFQLLQLPHILLVLLHSSCLKLNLHCLITSALNSVEHMVGRRAGGRESTHDAHHCIIYIRAVCLAMSSLQAAYRTHRPGRARLHTPGCLLQQSR